MNKEFLNILHIIFLLTFPAVAGNSLHAEEYIFADSSSVKIQTLDKEYFETLRKEGDFDYGGEFTKVDPNTFKYRVAQFLRKIFEEARSFFKVIPVLVQILLWGMAVFFLIILITKTKLNRLFYSTGGIKEPDFYVQDTEENITDFDSAIQNETLRKQYRKAVRLLYLKIIHTLEQLELIKYSKEKTNIDYLRELLDNKVRTDFSGLTCIYNNVWYGQFDINEKQYQQYELNFAKFLKSINAKK